MAEVTEKSIVVEGVNKYAVADLKRVYGSATYEGAEFVFLEFPVVGESRNYRADTYTEAVQVGDEIAGGKALVYHVTLNYEGHVKEALNLGLDDFGRPDAVEIEA